MRRLIRILIAFGLIVVLAAAAGWWLIAGRGLSAREEPTWIETVVARQARHLAVPRALRDRSNPVAASPDAIASGLAHFADHCAVCHANDGSGNTDIGRNLYPKAPDMRALATQSLSDGELFAIIEHGVRLTGMPAWGSGTPEGERESWHLVHFIRHLPKLTEEEHQRMVQLNPKTADEWKEEQEVQEFLEGRDPAAGKRAPAETKKPPQHEHR